MFSEKYKTKFEIIFIYFLEPFRYCYHLKYYIFFRKLPLSKQNFEHLDIPNLLINIWSYNDKSHRNCSVCKQCEPWCIEVAKKKLFCHLLILILLYKI